MVNIVDKKIALNSTFVGAIPQTSNYYNYYYSYYSPIYIYDLNCTGIENSILDCPYDNSYHYCRYNQDAVVVCQRKYSYNTS